MKTIDTYSLDELKEQFPKAYSKVLRDWINGVYSIQSPYAREDITSLKMMCDMLDVRLLDWHIGGRGTFIKADVQVDEDDPPRDDLAYVKEILQNAGYKMDDEHPFIGLCPMTGYCADDDFLEQVWNCLEKGYSLGGAVESLATFIDEKWNCDAEEEAKEETMLEVWYDEEYTSTGICVS